MLIPIAGFAPGTVVTLGVGANAMQATVDGSGLAHFDVSEQQAGVLGVTNPGYPGYPHTYAISLSVNNGANSGLVVPAYAMVNPFTDDVGVLLDPYGNPPWRPVPYGSITEAGERQLPAYGGLALPPSVPSAGTGATVGPTGTTTTPIPIDQVVVPPIIGSPTPPPSSLTNVGLTSTSPPPASSAGAAAPAPTPAATSGTTTPAGSSGLVLVGAALLLGGALWYRSRRGA